MDHIYVVSGLSAKALAGQASEIVPIWLEWLSVSILLAISIKPLQAIIRSKLVGLIRFKSDASLSAIKSGDT